MKSSALPKIFGSVSRYLFNSAYAGIPLEVFLILTDECNYRCRVCSLWKGIYRNEERRPPAADEIKSLIDDASGLGIPALIISGGEPLLHPDILEIAAYACGKMESVRLNTNASLLTPETARELVRMGLDEVWISLDGVGEYFDGFRGVADAYARSSRGLENMHAARSAGRARKPRILIDTIVSAANAGALPGCVKTFADLGADELNFVHTCYVPPEAVAETERFLGMEGIYSGQFTTEGGKSAAGARLTKGLLRDLKAAARTAGVSYCIDPLLTAPAGAERPDCRCLFPWTNIMIFPGGDACACPLLDYVTIGNVRERGLMDVWNGDVMREIRRKAAAGFPLCRHCICTRRTPADHLKHRQTISRIFGTP